jgi:hypothetical protein
VLDHQRYLAQGGEALQPPETAAQTFVDEEAKKPARKRGRKSSSDQDRKKT